MHERRAVRGPSAGDGSRWPAPFVVVFALAGVLLALAAGPPPARAARAPSAEGPSEVLFPRQSLPLRFDHRAHAGRARLTCLYCHTAAAKSRVSGDRLLPPPSRCDACHGTNHDARGAVKPGIGPARDCAYCHEGGAGEKGSPARVVIPAPHVLFDHAAHVQRKVPCARCHRGVEQAGLATRANLPDMRSCLECHRDGGDAASASGCPVCHETRDGLRLETSFPAGRLLPPAWMHGAEHGPDWMLRHRTAAGANSEFCSTCHAERECTDCHDGRVRPRNVHPNDWLGMHAMAARQNDPNCGSCHRAQSFCISCHQRTGVAETSPYGNVTGRGRFHPPKSEWTDLPRTGRHHAFEAQRNITACVSCHTERDCAICHATAGRGGLGGLSPHPPGWTSACRSAFASNARPCLFCHTTGDPVLAPCQ